MDPRKEKRYFRKMDHPVHIAWCEGEAAAMYGKGMPPRLRTNPYRPGRRHDEWDRGYALADPLGDHHGKNS